MAKVEDCPGFETFGADVKAAREAKRLARKTLAEMVGIEWRYLANIENQGAIPSLPVMIQLIKVCGLPVERYFNPEIMREESEQRQRVSHKLKLCPEEYLPIIEGAIDGALKMEQTAKQGGRIIAASFWRFYINFPGTFPKVPGTSAGFLRFLSQSGHGHFQ
jgi:transcriptional regulator with XRE-family HTH domain